jgi:hypothetical protein
MSFSLISTTTVGAGGAASVTFSSIPGTYTDLVLLVSAKYSSAGYEEDYLSVQFNSDTGSNYTHGILMDDGFSFFTKGYTSPATRVNLGYIPGSNTNANFMSNMRIEIPYYASSNAKVIQSEWGWLRAANYESANGISGGGWTNTNAITSLTFFSPVSATIAQYSMFSLYGRTKGSGGATVS